MIYPSNFEQKVGFDRIREQIATRCTMHSARQKLDKENFSTDIEQIKWRLSLADEMRLVIEMESGFPNEEFPDLDEVLTKLKIEGTFLDTTEVVTLRKALVVGGEVVAFVTGRKEGLYPTLRRRSEGVLTFPEIIREINSIVDSLGKIKDNASPELNSIRRSIRQREGESTKRLQQILAKAKSAGYVESDAQISMRDGRAVIPVGAANKRKVQGFIHDESATGKTFFIEPVEVVELNNELKELEYSERREIVRILAQFTESIRGDVENIEQIEQYLADIDMIRAKARWASSNRCVKPIASIDGRLFLKNARHPILSQTLAAQGREIIPLNMEIDSKNRILIISGPNAGGKSVCLKSAGIIQYMFQCGFLVPTSENSELPIFKNICIDIGDEQSIDNDLSTYSSHLLNMKNMLAEATDSTFILIDEFGSGTEPIIGGAIAESILEALLDKGCYGVITTHYSNIKYYASNVTGVVNGAMMFDVQNIRPLFKLEMGKPGSSFAVEIARKIGLPEAIIKSAAEKVGSDHVNIEKQLREIARDKHYWQRKRDHIRVTDRKVEELEVKYAELLAKIKGERSEILKKAKQRAEELVLDANKQIESTIKTIREAQADKELTRMARKELEDFKDEVETIDTAKSRSGADIEREMERIERRRQRRGERKSERDAEKKVEKTVAEVKPVEIEIGTKVLMIGQDIPGVVTAIKGKKAQVAFGQMLTTVDKSKLVVVSSAEYKRVTRPQNARVVVSVDVTSRKMNFKDSIDVRGLRASDAVEAVRDFIDDAIMVGVNYVTILHGKGTGALKDEIRKALRYFPEIESADDEHADRGGSGITNVIFK